MKKYIYLLLSFVIALISCDSWIYDGEGNCEAVYTVSLSYTMNMEYADAFEHYVETVTICAFNTSGTLVYTKTEDAASIIANGQKMDVSDITPGKYTLVAWAEGEEVYADSYEFSTLKVGSTSLNDVTCKINRSSQNYVNHDITALFHGMVTNADLSEITDGERNVELDLTKNTNTIRIVLQQMSGEDLDGDDFVFEIKDDNGYMSYDNSLLADDEITYSPWSQYSGSAGVDEEGDTEVSAAIAEFTVGRLVYENSPRLTAYTSDGVRILSIPIIDYALLIKGNYNESLSDQEYLDRQDEYSMVFFLDETSAWLQTVVYINSWRVILSNVSL